jgi:hypothetical protein
LYNRNIIYAFAKVILSFYPAALISPAYGLLCLTGQDPSATPFVLFALLLLLLPLLFTLRKLFALFADRSHHHEPDEAPYRE